MNRFAMGESAVVKAWTAAVGVVMVMAGGAWAQTPQASEEELIRARQKISMMEGVLERAVGNGVENVLRRFRSVTPAADGFMLTGTPVVRGFRLESYGVFFDVEVPALRPPLAWTLGYLREDSSVTMLRPALSELKEIEQQISDSDDRRRIAQVVSRIERQLPPVEQRPVTAAGTAVAQLAPGPMPNRPLENPGEAFTREVKSALIDAMLEHSGSITVGPSEWLHVAARDNLRSDRLVPGDASDLQTIMLRVRGSDLASFRGGAITLDEARRRVEVTED